jgi:hypothetical protein
MKIKLDNRGVPQYSHAALKAQTSNRSSLSSAVQRVSQPRAKLVPHAGLAMADALSVSVFAGALVRGNGNDGRSKGRAAARITFGLAAHLRV